MRELTDHKINPANDLLSVVVRDEPGPGGANHLYEISGFTPAGAPERSGYVTIPFQNGPINEVGVNGVTHEALLVILVDRLQSFQRGPFACYENAMALTKLHEAQHWLHHRTRGRMARGVEGTNRP